MTAALTADDHLRHRIDAAVAEAVTGVKNPLVTNSNEVTFANVAEAVLMDVALGFSPLCTDLKVDLGGVSNEDAAHMLDAAIRIAVAAEVAS